MTPFELLLVCAPLVAPVTMAAVVQQESGGNPFTIHDNATGASYRPRTEPQAIALAQNLMAAGHSLDLGIGQINSQNLHGLGLTVETIFQPCANLQAAQAVLVAAWKQSGGNLPGTLSAYNTGRVNSAVGTRYAASVYDQAQRRAPVVPAIPRGRMPSWVSGEIPASAPGDGTPADGDQALRPVALRRTPAQTGDSPAGSSLRPQAGDLRPNLNSGASSQDR